MGKAAERIAAIERDRDVWVDDVLWMLARLKRADELLAGFDCYHICVNGRETAPGHSELCKDIAAYLAGDDDDE